MNYLFTIRNQLIQCDSSYIVAQSEQFCQATFNFDSEWDGYTKTVLFTNLTKEINKSILLDETNTCFIPWEIIKHLGYMNVFIRGDKGDSIGTTAFMCCPLPIYKSGAEGDIDFENLPTPDIYKQLLARLNLVETGGITAEEFNTFLIENEAFLQVSSLGHQNNATIANITTQIGEIDKGVHLLDERVQGIGIQLGKQLDKSEELEGNIQTNLSSIESLQTDMENAQKAINQNMNAYSSLATQVDMNAHEINTLQEQVADIESKLPIEPSPDPSVPDSQFQELCKQVNRNTANIATNKLDIAQALEKATNNKQAIETLSNKIDTNTENIQKNMNAINIINSKLKTINSTIEEIQQQLVSPSDEEVRTQIAQILGGNNNE